MKSNVFFCILKQLDSVDSAWYIYYSLLLKYCPQELKCLSITSGLLMYAGKVLGQEIDDSLTVGFQFKDILPVKLDPSF